MQRLEKIAKWEEEISRLEAAQKEMARKTQEKVSALRKKVAEEKRILKSEQDEEIADLVRSVYGNVDNMEDLREILAAFAEPAAATGQNPDAVQESPGDGTWTQ